MIALVGSRNGHVMCVFFSRPNAAFTVCRHVSFGLHELLRNNAANVHEAGDWAVIFGLIEVAGAGANPNAAAPTAQQQHRRKGQQRATRERAKGGNEDSGHGASSGSEAANSR